MTDDRQTKNAASEGTCASPCSIPAFPHPGTWNPNTGEAYHAPEGGMTLRDWFAGMALAGECANEQGWQRTPNQLAEVCFLTADAMMSARESNA